MKTLRKAISLTLMLAIVLTSVLTTSVFAATTFSDVDDSTQFGEAIYELVGDGVLNGYEDGSFKPEGTITRAEFAKVIGVAIEGTKAMWDAKETRFSDMAGHWAIPYVAYASNAGIINGYEDGTFRPDQTVTYAEAIKMIVCSLGYGPVVDLKLTPWYQGYINVANQIGLTKGAATLADNGASRGLVAQLISNRKSCKRLVQTGTDASGKPTFTTSNRDIINSEEEYEEEGVVIGVYDNTLRGSEITLTKSQINIDGETYTLSDDLKDRDDLVNFLGKRVEFVYEGSSKYTVTSIKIAGTNDVEEISVEQFDQLDGKTIYYYEDPEKDSKAKKFELDDNIYIVYNGYGVPSSDITDEFIEDAFDIETGLITFYNNDGDSAMDVAFIENYKTYILNATPTKSNGVYTIVDKNSFEEQLKINEDDATVYRVTTADGSPAKGSMSNLTSKSVVSIAQPLNRTAGTTIMVSTATVSGSITSMDEDYEEIEISSKTYTVAPYFRKLLEKDEKTYSFKVGSNVKLYLDYLGRIVSSEINVSSDPYAYLMGCELEDGKMDGAVRIKLLNESGKWMIYPLRDTVRINGKSYEQSDVPDVLAKSAGYINNRETTDPEYDVNAETAQLIKFKTTTSGGTTVVSEISTIGENNDGDINLAHHASYDTAKKLKCKKSGSTTSFVDENGKTVFTLNSTTKVFMVPADRKAGDTAYKKVSNSYFANDSNFFVEAYDLPDNGLTAKAVVYYREAGNDATVNTIYAATPSYIITDIRDSRNDEGVDCYKVTVTEIGKALYNEDGEEANRVIVYTEDKTMMKGYKVGDIIRYTSTDDIIDQVELVYDGEDLLLGDGSHYKKDYDGTTNYLQFMIGTVHIKEVEDGKGTIHVSPNFVEEGEDGEYTFDAGITTDFNVSSNTKFYGFNKEKGKIVPVDSSYAMLSPAIELEGNYEAASRVLVIVYKKTEVRGIINLDVVAQ